MKKAIVVFSSLFLGVFLFKVSAVSAEDATVTQTEVAATSVDKQLPLNAEERQQISKDRRQLQVQRKKTKSNREAAQAEEQELRQRITVALQANDLQTVTQLKEELKIVHQENVQGMQQDKQAMQTAKQELKNDIQQIQQIQQTQQAGNLPLKKDKDNNPPGPRGGPGTNWENKPGPQGGPGASPDKRPKIVNPPGPKGGPGAGPRAKR